MSQLAQTTLRSVIGRTERDHLFSNRAELSAECTEAAVARGPQDAPSWGPQDAVRIDLPVVPVEESVVTLDSPRQGTFVLPGPQDRSGRGAHCREEVGHKQGEPRRRGRSPGREHPPRPCASTRRRTLLPRRTGRRRVPPWLGRRHRLDGPGERRGHSRVGWRRLHDRLEGWGEGLCGGRPGRAGATGRLHVDAHLARRPGSSASVASPVATSVASTRSSWPAQLVRKSSFSCAGLPAGAV